MKNPVSWIKFKPVEFRKFMILKQASLLNSILSDFRELPNYKFMPKFCKREHILRCLLKDYNMSIEDLDDTIYYCSDVENEKIKKN